MSTARAHRARPLALVACLLLALAPARAQTAVSLAREGPRAILTGLPPILPQAELDEPLESGLTTGFLFEVSARDGRGTRTSGGALVEIRYELWDEVYLVTVTDALGRREKLEVQPRSKLLDWWRSARIEVGNWPELAAADSWQVRVELSVVPFSSAEQRETQRWVSRSLDAARRDVKGSEAATEATAEPPGLAISDVLNLLLATSIQRSSLTSFDWRLTVPPASAAKPVQERR